MASEFGSNNFLARWAEDQLSQEEKTAFEGSQEELHYRIILEGTDLLETPAFDNESSFLKVKEGSVKKTISLKPWIYAAAILLISIGLWSVLKNPVNTYSTQAEQQLTLSLPDGSLVILNSESRLSQKQSDWEEDREIRLEGEAYFKVEPGSVFKVKTEKGLVSVLGTQFSVQDANDVFEVTCYEGKVQVKIKEVITTLLADEKLRFANNQLDFGTAGSVKPQWLKERTRFKNAPLKDVIAALGKQYGVTIKTQSIDLNRKFTGSFTNTDLETALETISRSMGFKYIIEDKTNVALEKL